MAADYPGACAAIETKFKTDWTGTPLERVGLVNDPQPEKADTASLPAPWVLFEILHAGSAQIGNGTPGNSVVVFDGSIKIHVFVPSGEGAQTGRDLAMAAGEIFRKKQFYDSVTAGCFVRTGYDPRNQPRINGGEINDQDGLWFVTTATIPFEYWHRA